MVGVKSNYVCHVRRPLGRCVLKSWNSFLKGLCKHVRVHLWLPTKVFWVTSWWLVLGNDWLKNTKSKYEQTLTLTDLWKKNCRAFPQCLPFPNIYSQPDQFPRLLSVEQLPLIHLQHFSCRRSFLPMGLWKMGSWYPNSCQCCKLCTPEI